MMAVGLLMMSGILWPVLSGVLGDKPNEATRLVEATERTNNKAESLNDSFTQVIPPAPPGPTVRFKPGSAPWKRHHAGLKKRATGEERSTGK